MTTPVKQKLFLVLLIAVSISLFLAATSAGTYPTATTNAAQPPTASQPRVDLNSAPESDLEQLPGIGPASAKRIILGRPYSSVSDLSKAGIRASTVSKISPLVTAGSTSATAPETNAASSAASSKAKQAESSAQSAVSGQTLPANSQGMVWVTRDSGVYHYPNSRYYGKTKNGKYMSETDAIGAGYHARCEREEAALDLVSDER